MAEPTRPSSGSARSAGPARQAMSAVDAYTDGLLSPDQAQQIETSLDKRPDVRREIELQRRIDARLQRLFPPTSFTPDFSQPIPIVQADRAAPRSAARRWMALAAGLILACGLGAYFVLRSPPPGSTAPPVIAQGPSELEAAYLAQLATGFVPEEVCTTDEAFADWMSRRYQTPMVIDRKPEGLTLVGWSYPETARGSMGALLATIKGQQVVVFVEFKKPIHKEPPEPKDAGLSQFSRRIGDLMLYQVSPVGTSSLLEGFAALPLAR
jgi:hypothetical protein